MRTADADSHKIMHVTGMRAGLEVCGLLGDWKQERHEDEGLQADGDMKLRGNNSQWCVGGNGWLRQR